MPLAGATGHELPTAPGMAGQDFADCLSPGATPKLNIPVSAANNPNIPQWPQTSFCAPSAGTYGCPPGAFMVVPLPYMMNQNGQFFQFPYPMNQSQPLSQALPSNRFHMSCLHDTDACREEIDSAAPCKDASQTAAEIDLPPSAPKVGILDTPQDVAEPKSDIPSADCTTLADDAVALGTPRQIRVNAELASSVVDMLETSGTAKRAAIVAWMQPAVLDLALSANGTYVIQKALEMTGGETQMKLSHCLHGHVLKLLDSHHGNHVLQKSITMMPAHAVQFIFRELSFFPGGYPAVACHRFGCRVLERLLEHGEAGLTAPIVAAVVAEIDTLSRHPFANYVIQHILEHVPAHRSQVVHALIQAGVPLLAQHRVASNIIERAFEHSCAKDQQALAVAILSVPGAIVDMARGRYGSFTVRRMLDHCEGRNEALKQLGEAIPALREGSKRGRQIASRVSAALSELRS